MVVENVAVDISQHGLSTGSVDIAVRAIDQLAASVDEVFAALVDEGALRV